jgi:hypothetical protein
MQIYVLRIEGFANGLPCPIQGQYVKTFDFDAHDGQGAGEFTADPMDALHFKSSGEAFEFWRTMSTVRPLRDDFRPNRPLTASTVSVERYEEPTP